MILPSGTSFQLFFQLANSVPPERFEDKWRQKKVAAPPVCLGFRFHIGQLPLITRLRWNARQDATHLEGAQGEVNILPFEAHDLPPAHPCSQSEEKERFHTVIASRPMELLNLLDAQRLDLVVPPARRG